MNTLNKTLERIATLLGKRDKCSARLQCRDQRSTLESEGMLLSRARSTGNPTTSMPKQYSSYSNTKFRHKSLAATVCTIVSLMFGSMTANADERPLPPSMPFDVAAQNNTQQTFTIGAPEPDYYSMNPGYNPGYPEQMIQERGQGYYFRAGHQGGKALGTEESLTFFEAMPYTFWEETMFLADMRLWALNSGRMGGSVGAGFRRYFQQIDRTFGLITWFDVDATHPEDFTDITVTLESHGALFNWDTNIYIPFDLRKQDIGLDFADGSQKFVGNNILFDQIRTSAFSLEGFDTKWTTPIGTEFGRTHDMRVGAGFYNLNHDDIDNIWGWSGEISANFMRNLDVSMLVTDDETFDTRVTVNASWTFDPNNDTGERGRTWDRMILPPKRLWTVPKAEVSVVEADQIAINPTTGLPYYVVHVDSITGTNAPGNGAVENPFNTIESAINGANAVPIDTYDTVFVWSGSTYDSQPTIVVPEGKRFLGGGDRVEHQFNYNEFGLLAGPRARNDYDDGIFDPRPLFTNLGVPGGPGVTFELLTAAGGTVISNDDTEFSGFVLGNPDAADMTSGDADSFDPTTTTAPGQGPLGNGIEFVTLTTDSTITRFVDINGAVNNGLDFTGTDGTFDLQSMIINQSGNHEMFVSGGSPDITMKSSTRGETDSRVDSIVVNRDNGSGIAPDTLTGVAGDNHDLVVQATTGGSVIWTDVITNDLGGDGFIITGASQSDVTIPISTTITNSRGNGIGIFPGVDGDIVISGTRTDGNPSGNPMIITNPEENAIQIGLATAPITATLADVTFVQPISINQLDRLNSGIIISNTSGNTVFQTSASTQIAYNTATVGTASAFEFFQNFGGNLTLNNAMTITSPGGAGIRISNDDNIPAGVTPGIFRYLAGSGGSTLSILNASATQGVGGAAIVIGADPPAGAPNNSPAGTGYESSVIFDVPITITNSNGAGIHIDSNTGNVSFSDSVNIDTNLTGGTSIVGIFNNTGDVFFNSLDIEGFISPDVDFVDDNEPTAAELAAMFASLDMRFNTGTLTFNDIIIEGGNTQNNIVGSTGIFGYNNNEIVINDGDIDVNFATAVEIFTADSAVGAGLTYNLTDLNLELRNVESTFAPDHGVHLANVKGQATFNGGDITGAGSNFGSGFPGPNFEAGIYVDNSLVRILETQNFGNPNPNANGLIFGQTRQFNLDVNDMDLDLNTAGILAIAIDDVMVDTGSFTLNSREAIDLRNVVTAQVISSDFTNNQSGSTAADFGSQSTATIRSVYTLTLNDENSGLDSNPTFYDLVIGPRNADFDDPTANDDQNTFDEDFSHFCILMQNQAQDNVIGVLDNGFSGTETGFIVNNNAFDSDATALRDFQGFIHYRDISGANSRTNINIVMNSMEAADDNFANISLNDTDQGAIGVIHISDDTVNDDDLVFNAIDNLMDLGEEGSIGFYFIDQGEGSITINIDDNPDDGLTEGGFEINDPNFADLTISEGPAFFFDLETDADISIQNLEIQITEDEDTTGGGNVATTIDEQRVFFFDNVSGTADINIGGNTILIDDAGAIINPFNGQVLLVNDILVTEFDAASGDINLNSQNDNTVLINPLLIQLTNPDLLFDAPISADFTGQLQFNGIFVP